MEWGQTSSMEDGWNSIPPKMESNQYLLHYLWNECPKMILYFVDRALSFVLRLVRSGSYSRRADEFEQRSIEYSRFNLKRRHKSVQLFVQSRSPKEGQKDDTTKRRRRRRTHRWMCVRMYVRVHWRCFCH